MDIPLRSSAWPQPLMLLQSSQESFNTTALVILLGVLLPIIVEELVFRGLLLGLLLRSGMERFAIFIQAVAYALLFHEPLFWIIPFLMGWGLGYVRAHSASLWPTLILRTGISIGFALIQPIMPTLMSNTVLVGTMSGRSNFTLSWLLLLIGLICMHLYLRNLRKQAGQRILIDQLSSSETSETIRALSTLKGAKWWPLNWSLTLGLILAFTMHFWP